MKRCNLQKFNKQIIFSKKDLAAVDSSISPGSLNSNIHRWIEDRTLIQLKNGLYISGELFEQYRYDRSFNIAIANSLRFPSYVTADTILREHDILSDATFGITSFTLKITRVYENLTGTYRYHKIKKDLYCGYNKRHFNDKEVFFASKAKALFDFLYLKSQFLPVHIKNVNVTEELRLNLDSFSKEDYIEFDSYRKLVAGTKQERIINNIMHYASDYTVA
ncbi:MAG: hypothetical protein ACOCXT_00145 [Candidatus Dojkabacteria bacterium]